MLNSGTNDEDLEDGEIFDDDDDDQTVPLPQPPAQQSQIRPLLRDEPLLQVVSPHPKRRMSSPNMMDRKRQQQKNRRGKRNRDDDRLFQQRKKRRNNDEKLVQRDKDVPLEDEDSLLRSGNSPNWENKYEKSDGYILDEEDEEMCGPTRRGGRMRDFSGRQRRMRNNRGGRRGCGGGGPGNASGPHRRGGGVGGSGGGDNMCKFFLQGKCHRGTDCTFSHQTHSNRKFELCKFYMNDCCTKKDKCMYMHGDFPCKFHHLGLKCYAGKRCKFSHYPVSNFVKQMLVKHNQTESDKHFLLQLETRSPGRGSPDFLDFHNQDDQEEDYAMDGPNGGPFDQLGGNSFEPQAGRNNRNQNNMNHGQLNRMEDREKKRDRSQAPHNPKQTRQEEQSGEEDANVTPMPSPPDNDRDNFSPGKDENMAPAKPLSPHSENKMEADQLPHQSTTEDVPSSLPQKQRELFMRIQQQQHRQSSSLKGGEEQSSNKDDEYKEEDWYSSDDEGNPLSTILKTIKPKTYPAEHNQESKSNLPTIPKSLPDIDINEVSKLLETIKQKGAQQEEINQNKENKSKINILEKPEEKRRVRDPRLQKANNATALANEDKASQPVISGKNTLQPGDVDLRVGMPLSDLATPSKLDIDLRQLPFKPAPVHQAANEIDASIKSHMIINYVLKPFPQQPKPDYNGVQAKCVGDPRLKMTGVQPQPLKPVANTPTGIVNPFMIVGQPVYNVDTSHPPPLPAPVQSRDPRQRALANDPRRKNLQPPPPPSVIPQHHPPPALRFGQELPIQPQFFHQQRGDSDLRNQNMFNVGDVDLRFQQPPTPRFVFK